MSYVRVSSWHGGLPAAQTGETLRVRRELGPILRSLPGLVAFRVFDLDDRTLVVTSIWESAEDARAGAARAGRWLGEHVGEPRRPAEMVVVCDAGRSPIGELGHPQPPGFRRAS